MPRDSVLVTESFARNLEEIRAFLSGREATGAFDALLDRLYEQVIPTLRRFPDAGRDFLGRAPRSAEGLVRVDALRARLGPQTTLREYITREYLVLYAVRNSEVLLLAIRHHRQLSFDLGGHWEP